MKSYEKSIRIELEYSKHSDSTNSKSTNRIAIPANKTTQLILNEQFELVKAPEY